MGFYLRGGFWCLVLGVFCCWLVFFNFGCFFGCGVVGFGCCGNGGRVLFEYLNIYELWECFRCYWVKLCFLVIVVRVGWWGWGSS